MKPEQKYKNDTKTSQIHTNETINSRVAIRKQRYKQSTVTKNVKPQRKQYVD